MRFGVQRMHPEDVLEVLELRRQGWSFPSIARKFKRDHSTIFAHCKKYGVVPLVPVQRKPADRSRKRLGKFEIAIQAENTPVSPYDHFIEVRKRSQKKYADYLAEAREREKNKPKQLRPWIKNYMQFKPSPKNKDGKAYRIYETIATDVFD